MKMTKKAVKRLHKRVSQQQQEGDYDYYWLLKLDYLAFL
jgi:hypothetical protein